MGERTIKTQPKAQSYIIKRPRLTKLLDESGARIILLCAPAGYGKTTLAREWVDAQVESVAWYSALLGLTKIMDEPHEGGRAVVLMQPQAGLFIGLHAHDANAGERFVETRTGLDHVSLGVPNREVLVAWQQRLAERGVVHSPIADVSYGSVLVLRDPDNIQLEFIAPAQG